MKKVSKTYLMAEPNAGMPELVKEKVVYPASPKVMADYTEKFIELGINLIGGCCGTTPLHIKAMSRKIKN
jgi:5-methyltetrahydrofolate--homocysteine methyltransferase